ncbi:HEAT repeat domain-containing protein [Myxococcus sp. QH3KD-4-1]|nr:HEAT repeat domain-containing protein [Myxococcus qinghaiensis]
MGSTLFTAVGTFVRKNLTWGAQRRSFRTQELIEKLKEGKDREGSLRDLAKLGVHARPAGVVVVESLASDDWEVRVAATLTLGFIQYAEATDVLISQLAEVSDWRRVRASARALGRLHAERALRPLERLAVGHWYPPVREAASQAIRVIRGEASYPEEPSTSEFFWHVHRGERLKVPSRPFLDLGPDELPAISLAQRIYAAKVLDTNEHPWRMKLVSQKPRCGLRVSDGYLLGDERGEWGGELVHQRDDATETHVFHRNVWGIHRLGPHIIVVTGLAHLGGNEGRLYRVFPQGETFGAEFWRELPGAPECSGWLSDGRLYIECLGGAVLVSPEGDFELAEPDTFQAG